MRDFTAIIARLSDHQIDCLNKLKQNNLPHLDVMYSLLSKVRDNIEFYTSCEDKKNELIQLYKDIREEYAKLKLAVASPYSFYDKNYLSKEG